MRCGQQGERRRWRVRGGKGGGSKESEGSEGVDPLKMSSSRAEGPKTL